MYEIFETDISQGDTLQFPEVPLQSVPVTISAGDVSGSDYIYFMDPSGKVSSSTFGDSIELIEYFDTNILPVLEKISFLITVSIFLALCQFVLTKVFHSIKEAFDND